jgi:hypothetical protein
MKFASKVILSVILHFLYPGEMRMHADADYDRHHVQKSYIIPEVIKNFLTYFQKSINEQNVYEIQNAYENGYELFMLCFSSKDLVRLQVFVC